MAKLTRSRAAGLIVAAVPACSALADLAVPAYSSRPGATYTLYLDFGGFAFNGQWANSGGTPGVTAPYTVDGDATSFSSAEISNIQQIWAWVAEKYVAFDINVTTVDPAVAAGHTSTDSDRQLYYDSTPMMMHTVIGGNGSWFGGGGVSYVGVTQDAWPTSNGFHTNWVFAAQAPGYLQFVGEAASHENGHGLNLYHQSDYGTNGTVNGTGSTLISEYSSNGTPANGNYAGNGSFAPTMGVSYYTQRGLWRVGASEQGVNTPQNDYAEIGSNLGVILMDDGVAHAMTLRAGDLPLASGQAVDPAKAKGFITPTTLSNPNPIGANNYTKDYFRIFSLGTPLSLTCFDGSENVSAGTADGGATLDSTLKIFDANGNLVSAATRAADTLSESLAVTLPVGNYYVEVASVGGYQSAFDPTAKYFTAGSYFLKGSGLYVLSGLNNLNLAGYNFAGLSMAGANLAGSTLTGANLANADLSFADLRGAAGFSPSANTSLRGAILPNGTINSFSFAAPETLAIRANATSASLVGTSVGNGSIVVTAGGRLSLAAPGSAASNVRLLDGATVSLAGTAGNLARLASTTVTAPHAGSGAVLPEVAVLSSLSIASDGAALGARAYYGLLDLGTNDAVVRDASLPDLADMARAFLASGKTAGIGSTSPLPYTSVAVILNDAGFGDGTRLCATFDGVPVTFDDALLKFTYTGDTDLNGVVDGGDLANLLAGQHGALTGWQNGDLNYDGVVNSADLSLLLAALAGQGAPLGGIGAPAAGAVPEPSLLALAPLALPLFRRVRRARVR